MPPTPLDLTRRPGGPENGDVIADLADLAQHRAAVLEVAGVPLFIQPRGSGAVAYVNRCPHLGLPLDLKPGTMFHPGLGYFICSTHGAVFDPESGLCLGGPCAGRYLQPVAICREGTRVRAVQLPAN